MTPPALQENPIASVTPAPTFTLQQTRVTLKISWTSSCATTPPVATSTMTLNVTKSGVTKQVFADVTGGASGTAVAQVYLPQGDYKVVPVVDSNSGWSAPTPDALVHVDSPATTNGAYAPASIALVPGTVPLTVNMTIDGAGADSTYQASSGTAPTPTTAQFNAGAATLCVSPAPSTSVTVSDSAGNVRMAPQLVDASKADPTATFTGFTVVPTISDVVKDRPSDSRDVTVAATVTDNGVTLAPWGPTAQVNIPTSGTVTLSPGSRPIVDKGAKIVVTATPATGDPFTQGQGTVDDVTTNAAAVAVNLVYARAIVIVKVTNGSGDAVANANVTIQGTTTTQKTSSGGIATLVDIQPGSYTIVADDGNGNSGQQPTGALIAGQLQDLTGSAIVLKPPSAPSSGSAAPPPASGSAAPPSASAVPSTG